MTTTKKIFSRTEFADLFHSELLRCRQNFIDLYSKGPFPLDMLLLLSDLPGCQPTHDDKAQIINASADCLYEVNAALDHLHRESDGWYREWIILSPLAVWKDRLIIQIEFASEWSDQIFSLSPFQGEPIQLRGPALPMDSLGAKESECTQRVSLPKLKLM